MRRKRRVWYSAYREDKDWYHNGKWMNECIAPCSNVATFKTLKKVNKHLNKEDNQDGTFNLTKWYVKHGQRWAIDYKVYPANRGNV